MKVKCVKFLYFLALIGCLTGCYNKQPEKTKLKGKLLPEFQILLQDSTIYTINSGNTPIEKPIVLYYFGPDCPYSKAQMEEIIDNINILNDIQFYACTAFSLSEMKYFYNYYNLGHYSNIKVGMDYKYFFNGYFETRKVPYIAIYGKDKRLRQTFIGKIDSRQIKEVAEE